MPEKLALDLDVRLEGAQSVQELKDIIKEAKNEAIKFGEGTDEFNRFSQVAADARNSVQNLDRQIQKLDPGKKFSSLISIGTTITGGLTAATAAAALFGAENEDVHKSLLKVQATTAALQGIQAIFSGPIGPIQVLGVAVTGLVVAFNYFNNAAERANRILKKNIEANNERREAIEASNSLISEANGLELERMKALGKSTTEINAQKNAQEQLNIASNEGLIISQKENLANAQKQLQNLENKGFAFRGGIIGGASKDDLKESAQNVLEAQQTLDKLEAGIISSNTRIEINNLEAANDRKKINAERITDLTKTLAEQKLKDEEGLVFQRELEAEINQALIDAYKVQEKELEDHNKKVLEQETELRQSRVDGMVEGAAKEIAVAQLAFEQKYAAAAGNAETEKQLVTNLGLEIDAINAEHDAKEIASAKKTADELKAIATAKRDAIISGAGGLVDGLDKLITKGEARNKKEADRNKVIASFQLGVDMARGLSSAIAAGAAAGPFPANLAAIATGVGVVLTNFAAARKLFSTSGITPPDVPDVGKGANGMSGGRDVSRPPDIFPGSQRTLLDDAERRRGKQAIIVEAVVVETDMTSSQKEVAVANGRARRRVR